MAYSISILGANTAIDSFLIPFSNGCLELRTGVRPLTPDTAATGITLATIPLSASPFNASVLRTATLNATASDLLGDANGSATWFRMYDNIVPSLAAHIMDGDVGAVGSGADMELADGAAGTVITTSDKVSISSMSVTL